MSMEPVDCQGHCEPLDDTAGCRHYLGVRILPTFVTPRSSDFDSADAELHAVCSALLAHSNIATLIGEGLRRSFDEVIDGPRTGRFRIEQLEKTEKTYIGTKVEIVLRNELELPRGRVLDNLIGGIEVDTKFSLSGDWMIPREAFDQLCLLVSGNDNSGVFNLGLLRMSPEVLTLGANQDAKKTVSAAGKARITWLVRNAPMPRNFLLDLDPTVRELIMSQRGGVQRIRQLFLNVTGQLIPRTAIEQVAQQKDPMRRARQMKDQLLSQGVRVLCAKYDIDRSEIVRQGFANFRPDDWLSLPYP